MRTMNLYEVTVESKAGDALTLTMHVAAVTAGKAKKQTQQYSKTIRKVTKCKRIGNVWVPLVIPAGL